MLTAYLNKKHYNKVLCMESLNRLRYTTDTIPMISVYYYNSKQTIDDNISIPIYFTDYYQREYYYNDFSLKFRLMYEVDGDVRYIENLPAGDFNLELGKLSEGVHHYSIQIQDFGGRTSRRIFNDILVIDPNNYDIKNSEIYTITDNDLSSYNINKNNSSVEADMINTRVGLTKLFSDKSSQGYRKLILPLGIYRVNRCIRNGTVQNNDCPIIIPSGTTIDMNGSTFKLDGYDDRTYGERAKVENCIVRFVDCVDSHLMNGIVEGNYAERLIMSWSDGSNAIEGSNGEHDNAITISGGEYCSLDNITITQVAGYNVCTGYSGDYGSIAITKWDDNKGVNNGELIDRNGYSTSKIMQLTEGQINSHYIQGSRYLGYGYIKGKQYHMYFSFYDSNKAFIEEIKVYQYQRCRIPNGSKYVRVTLVCNSNLIEDFNIYHMKNPRYCDIKNCTFVNNRTCSAPNQFQFLLYDNCTFENCGQSITACCIDIEDGWEQSQDLFIKNCENLTNNVFLITGATYNLVVEDCKNVSMEIRPRTIMTCLKNITGENTVIKYLSQTSDVRIEYPIISFRAFNLNGIKDIYVTNDETHPIKIKGLKIIGDGIFSNKSNTKIEDLECYSSRTHLSRPTVKDISGVVNYYIGRDFLYVGSEDYEKNIIDICSLGKGAVFQPYGDINKMTFSMNSNYMKYIFIESIFTSDCVFKNHNNFTIGMWKDCVFEGTVDISGNKNVNIGDIEYNGCVFKKQLTITANGEFKVLFANCIFEQGVICNGLASDNCIFNECTGY